MFEDQPSGEGRQFVSDIEDHLGVGNSCVNDGYVGDTGISIWPVLDGDDPLVAEHKFRTDTTRFVTDLIVDCGVESSADILTIESSVGFVDAVRRHPEEFLLDINDKKVIFINEFHDSSKTDITLGELYDTLVGLLEARGDKYPSARVYGYFYANHGIKMNDSEVFKNGTLDNTISIQGFSQAVAKVLEIPVSGMVYIDTGREDLPEHHKGYYSRYQLFHSYDSERKWTADVIALTSEDLGEVPGLPQWTYEKLRFYTSRLLGPLANLDGHSICYDDVAGRGVDIIVTYEKEDGADYPVLTYTVRSNRYRTSSSGPVVEPLEFSFSIDCGTSLITANNQIYNHGDQPVSPQQLAAFIHHPGVRSPFHPNSSTVIVAEVNPFADHSMADLMQHKSDLFDRATHVSNIMEVGIDELGDQIDRVVQGVHASGLPVDIPEYRTDDFWPNPVMEKNDLPWVVTHTMVLLDLAATANF